MGVAWTCPAASGAARLFGDGVLRLGLLRQQRVPLGVELPPLVVEPLPLRAQPLLLRLLL